MTFLDGISGLSGTRPPCLAARDTAGAPAGSARPPPPAPAPPRARPAGRSGRRGGWGGGMSCGPLEPKQAGGDRFPRLSRKRSDGEIPARWKNPLGYGRAHGRKTNAHPAGNDSPSENISNFVGRFHAGNYPRKLNTMQVQIAPNSKIFGHDQNGRMTKPYEDIALRLIAAREALGLSQAEFARRARIGVTTMNNWESGDYRVSLNGALRLRETYGLSLDFIYCGNIDMLPNKIASALRSSPRERASR